MRVVLLAVGYASIFASAGRMTFGKTYQKSGILNGTWGFDGHNCTISLSPRLPAGVNPSANSQLLYCFKETGYRLKNGFTAVIKVMKIVTIAPRSYVGISSGFNFSLII